MEQDAEWHARLLRACEAGVARLEAIPDLAHDPLLHSLRQYREQLAQGLAPPSGEDTDLATPSYGAAAPAGSSRSSRVLRGIRRA